MSIERLFALGSVLPHDMVRWGRKGSLTAPEDWSLEAAEAFHDALFTAAPSATRTLEENTMPSWLWRRVAQGKETRAETSVMEVFDRIAGAATSRGWKSGLWKNEIEASSFYDEIRALLLTRRLILAPKDMARMGLDWAYGIAPAAAPHARSHESEAHLLLQNETIDSILGDKGSPAKSKWIRFLEASQKQGRTSVLFADTAAEWNVLPSHDDAPRAMLNLTAFRRDDGSLDAAGLAQASELAVLLLELHEDVFSVWPRKARPLAIGFCNLASLLMGLALPYDSEAGRNAAAAVAALITSAACRRSAELAAKLGPCSAFAENREAVLRHMENQLRAAFGEKTDYDRLSVLPQSLELESGLDLVLLSAARHTYEQAIGLVRAHGLRHLRLTALFHDPVFAPLADAFSQGIEAEACLACDCAAGNELFGRRLNPSVPVALARLGHDAADKEAARNHILGYRTLVAAPGVSYALLREKGFDEETLERVEIALSSASRLRDVFTPWVLGEAFCRETLRVPTKKLADPSFDLLKHLGFSSKDIALANAFCFGHHGVKGFAEVAEKDRSVFATREDLSPEAFIRMAAAVQTFVMGDVGLSLFIPAAVAAQVRGELLLMGWKSGLRSMTLCADGPLPLAERKSALLKRRTKASIGQKTQTAKPRSKPKASTHTLALRSRSGKPVVKEKRG